MKKIIFIIFFGMIYYAHSQIITIKDENTNEPIEMVSISSENPKAYTKTNTKGQAEIKNFIGSIKISLRSIGYKTETFKYSDIESKSYVIFLKPTSIDVDEVVVSASRWIQPSNIVPARVISISPKEINLQNPQTAADLLNVSGEVFIQKSQQGGGSPMIRGFATNRLLYSVDGVRMNTAIFRAGNIQNVISLDPFAIEKTEVLFGPSSVMYGSDAIGGVMSFQTLTPQLSFSDKQFITGKAIMRYSSANNEKTGHFDINVGWENWALLTSLSYNDFGEIGRAHV